MRFRVLQIALGVATLVAGFATGAFVAAARFIEHALVVVLMSIAS